MGSRSHLWHISHFGENGSEQRDAASCDPIWHVSSRSGAVLVAQTAICFLTLPYLTVITYSFGEVTRNCN